MTHNLPAELTSFIGRDAELVELERLVSERRLVTLTGVGGCGKTRLAVQLGARFADRWPDGFWLVDLGSVSDPELTARLAASTLGVLIEPGGDQVQALAAQLGRRELLLCLDTCEHLLDATAALADTLLRRCPGVSVLATSREPLGVEGETVWRVPSLKREEAVRLFADRAGLVAPSFDVRAALDDVGTVCAKVDRIPLAIELAAAWVRALTPAQIAAGLEDCLRLLTGGGRRAIPRHQTLLASMGWSHALLADEEKILFRRLAVFSGTFTLDAAASVCFDPVRRSYTIFTAGIGTQLEALTEREQEVVGAVTQGLSNAEIGKRLFISEATVKAHVSRVLAKLGMSNRVQAAILAHEAGLLN